MSSDENSEESTKMSLGVWEADVHPPYDNNDDNIMNNNDNYIYDGDDSDNNRVLVCARV